SNAPRGGSSGSLATKACLVSPRSIAGAVRAGHGQERPLRVVTPFLNCPACKVAQLAKLERLILGDDAEGRRIFLFSQFTSLLEQMESDLSGLDIRYIARRHGRPWQADQAIPVG